jgi:hypothetical protein
MWALNSAPATLSIDCGPFIKLTYEVGVAYAILLFLSHNDNFNKYQSITF